MIPMLYHLQAQGHLPRQLPPKRDKACLQLGGIFVFIFHIRIIKYNCCLVSFNADQLAHVLRATGVLTAVSFWT